MYIHIICMGMYIYIYTQIHVWFMMSYILIWTTAVYFHHINWWPPDSTSPMDRLLVLSQFQGWHQMLTTWTLTTFFGPFWWSFSAWQWKARKKHTLSTGYLDISGHEMESGHWNNRTLSIQDSFIDLFGAKLAGWTDIMYRVQDSYDFIAWKT